MTLYALIENASGYLWWFGEAADPIAAAHAAQHETSNRRPSDYRLVEHGAGYRLASNASGYHVYEMRDPTEDAAALDDMDSQTGAPEYVEQRGSKIATIEVREQEEV